MKRAIAVIGAAWGDEGKGLMTDYFCRQAGEEPWVVRFNGGAQAGHTVVCPKHGRHVFHHFGAGTFAGARTYLSRFFLVNPVLWKQEYDELQGKGLRTRIFVDREAPLTTVWDMLENQTVERLRNSAPHGSCGVGINATMQRQKHPELRLFAGDLERPAYLEDRLFRISEWYAHTKARTYMTHEIYRRFLADCAEMARQINLCDSRALVDRPAEIVFEGAQGLLLDQDSSFFPHVTHSKTGLANVLKIAAEIGVTQIDACYVARPYLTRHGAGPLPGEDVSLRYEDDTNIENPWQGRLRFAPMDIKLVEEAIFRDLVQAKKSKEINVTPLVAVTHLDQHDWRYARPRHFESYGSAATDVRDCRRR